MLAPLQVYQSEFEFGVEPGQVLTTFLPQNAFSVLVNYLLKAFYMVSMQDFLNKDPSDVVTCSQTSKSQYCARSL